VKFCIDCKHFRAGSATYMLGFVIGVPDYCGKPRDIDPVSGRVLGAGEARLVRADEEKCGKAGKWFEPGTLDGRLAMLEEDGGKDVLQR
jgi:hypothetical protein